MYRVSVGSWVLRDQILDAVKTCAAHKAISAGSTSYWLQSTFLIIGPDYRDAIYRDYFMATFIVLIQDP